MQPLPGGRDFTCRISDGPEGVRETMAIMRRIVRASKGDPDLIQLARGQTLQVSSKDWRGEARALFNFVQGRIRYVRDPNGIETLATPARILEMGAGDCDEMSVLLASLLEAIGHPTRFKAVGFEPGNLSHVYVQTLIGQEWVSMDATENRGLGWEPDDYVNAFIVSN